MEIAIGILVHYGRTINKHKMKGPDTSTKCLRVLWASEGPKIPGDILPKMLYIPTQRQKSDATPNLYVCTTEETHTIFTDYYDTPL